MGNKRLCIICNTMKTAFEFDRIGEHIVPESLGNHTLVTPHVCSKCNGGLGGTVDFALRQFYGVSQACTDRNVAGTNGSIFESRRGLPDNIADFNDVEFSGYFHGREVFVVKDDSKTAKRLKGDILLYVGDNDNFISKEKDAVITHEIIGAWLKIAYEVTHLILGDEWLFDELAVEMREILHAYAEKRISEAQALIDSNKKRIINASKEMKTSKKHFTDIATKRRTCINSLWLAPIKNERNEGVKVVIDIEGLPAVCITVSNTMRYEDILMILPKVG